VIYLQQERALTPPAKKLKISTELETVPATEKSPDTIAQELLVRIEKRLDRIEKRQDVIMNLLKTRTPLKPGRIFASAEQADVGVVKVEGDEDEDDFTVSGTNLLRLPARDAYSYALSLVDIIFTKEELSSSLLFKSAKSEKPGLPKLGVDKLFGKWRSKGSVPASLKEVCSVAWSCSSHYSFFVLCSLLLPIACIEKRYGKSYEIRTLTSKVNQKCRDTARPQKPPKDICDPL